MIEELKNRIFRKINKYIYIYIHEGGSFLSIIIMMPVFNPWEDDVMICAITDPQNSNKESLFHKPGASN